ncbi:MAG: hypothetical protein ABFD92_01990 [Planctomycetaceae bacterium]|nr:hypothetical protein [Planctomycetaceae bacterium]
MKDVLSQLMNAQTLAADGVSAAVIDLGEGFAPVPHMPVLLDLNVTALTAHAAGDLDLMTAQAVTASGDSEAVADLGEAFEPDRDVPLKVLLDVTDLALFDSDDLELMDAQAVVADGDSESTVDLGATAAGGPMAISLDVTALAAFDPADLELASAQVIAATADSESTVDLGRVIDGPMEFTMDVTAVKTSAGTETYTVEVFESADEQAWTTTGLKFTVAAAAAVSGHFTASKRYVKFVATLGGDEPSMTLDAAITAYEAYTAEVMESADEQAWTSTGAKITVAAATEYTIPFVASQRYVKLAFALAGTASSLTASAAIVASESYAVEVMESADGETWTSTGARIVVDEAAEYEIGFKALARYVKLAFVLAGTASSLTADAHVSILEPLECEVQESADGVTYASTGLRFAVTAAEQIVKLVGITQRYVRLRWYVAGRVASVTASAWLNPA